MKIQINIEKRHLLLLVAVIAIASIGIALAVMPTTAQNPGHTGDQIQCDKCIGTDNIADGAVTNAKLVTTATQACATCLTCGGTWPNNMGSVYTSDIGDATYPKRLSYGESCSGTVKWQSGAWTSLCCK